jgi:hypothetical protein
VGTEFSLKETVVKLSRSDSTLQEIVMEMVWSSGFLLLTFLPFVHCTEIWKRIQFINSWGNFQVNIFYLLVHETIESFILYSTTTEVANTPFEHVTKR